MESTWAWSAWHAVSIDAALRLFPKPGSIFGLVVLVVSCRYKAASTRQISARQIEPGELYWDPGLESLYVIGWCRLRQDVRVFAVQRFVAVSITDQAFAPRPEARSRAALRHAFRVWRGDNVERVRIRFTAEVADEIRERRWAVEQQVHEEPGGNLILSLSVAGLAEVQRWVLGFGGGAEVLAPAELRRGVAAACERATSVYSAPKSKAARTAGDAISGKRRGPVRS